MEKLTLNSDHGSACSTASYGKKRTAGYDIQNKLVCLTYNRKDNPWKEEDVDEMYKKFASDEFYSGDAEVTVALEEPNHLHMIYSRSAAGARIDCNSQHFAYGGVTPNVSGWNKARSGCSVSRDRTHFYTQNIYKTGHVKAETNHPIRVAQPKWIKTSGHTKS